MSDLKIEKIIELNDASHNIPPLLVRNLCLVNEPDNELVQYYVTDNSLAEDKCTNIVLANYSELNWKNKKRRLTLRNVSRIGLKHFPGIGAIAYFKYKYENRSMILCPVNNNKTQFTSPTLKMDVSGNDLIFTITPPEDITYKCYRIILENDYFAYEYITYENTLTVPKPEVKGTYTIYCIGYVNEGEAISFDSNVLDLTITTGQESFAPKAEIAYYTKEQIDAMFLSSVDKYLKAAAFTNKGTKLQFTMSDDSTFYAEGSPGGGIQTPVTILATITATPDSKDAHKCIGNINVTANSDIILCVISRSDLTVPEGYELLYAIDPIINSDSIEQSTYIYKKHCIDTSKQDITVTQTGTNSSFGFFACNIVGANNYFVGDIINANETNGDVSEVTLVKSSTNALVISQSVYAHTTTVISKYAPDTDCLIYNAGPRCHFVVDKSNTTVHTLGLGGPNYGDESIAYKIWQTVVLNIS